MPLSNTDRAATEQSIREAEARVARQDSILTRLSASGAELGRALKDRAEAREQLAYWRERRDQAT